VKRNENSLNLQQAVYILAVAAYKFLIINYYIPSCLNVTCYIYGALQDKLMFAKGHELFRDTVTAQSPELCHISVKRQFITVFVSRSGFTKSFALLKYVYNKILYSFLGHTRVDRGTDRYCQAFIVTFFKKNVC